MDNLKEKKEYLYSAYNKYADQIYRYCLTRIQSRELAEDIVQDCFVKTWKYILNGNTKIDNTKAFLFKTSRNLIIDAYRKRETKNNREEWIEDALKKRIHRKHLSINQIKIIEDKGEVEELYRIIASLSSNHQDVIILRYIEEMSPKEISEILDITPKNVSAMISRAKSKIKKLKLENKSHE